MTALDVIVVAGSTLGIEWCLRWYWRNDFFDLRSIYEDWRYRREERGREELE